MTRFWREGHHRSNRWGGMDWVEGHWVVRTDWDRWSYSSPPPRPAPHIATNRVSAVDHGFRASFTIPNASCPVCGARVFFYQNDFGSRVFFDSLGPPWPKHPCTDTRSDSGILPGVATPTKAASTKRITDFLDQIDRLRTQTPGELLARQLDEGWRSYAVVKRTHRAADAYFAVKPIDGPNQRPIRFSLPWRDDLPDLDEIVFLNDDRISFFSFELFEPCELTVRFKPRKSRASSWKKGRRKRRKRK